MDKYDFMSIVDEILDECTTKEEMDSRLKQMREIIRKQYILKLCFKRSMGELKGK